MGTCYLLSCPPIVNIAEGIDRHDRAHHKISLAQKEAAIGVGGQYQIVPVIPEGMPYGHAVVGLSIHEGKKHQVKRMLAAIGHEVVRLHRDEFGPLVLSGVQPGCWRLLTDDERKAVETA